MVAQPRLRTPGLVTAIFLGAVLATACGDSEGGTGGSSGEGEASSSSSSSEGGGTAAEACSGDDLDDCFFECDYLNTCLDAATQQDCRDHCREVSPTACIDYAACGQRDSSCDNAEDCWDVFRGEPGTTTSVSSSSTGGGDPSCSTACANVTAQCGDDGGIDFATCMEQCANYSPSAIACATDATSCDAVLECVGAGGG